MLLRQFFCAAVLLLPGFACQKPQKATLDASRNYPRSTPVVPRAKPTPELKGSVTGRVIGADGKPVAGASVWVVASYAGIRLYNETFAATTGADGAYRVGGLPSVRNHSLYGRRQGQPGDIGVSVYAVAPGRPPANVLLVATMNTTAAPDLILPAQGSSLVVRVLDEAGKPIRGTVVEASAVGGSNSSPRHFARESNRQEADSLRDILHPRHTTDADGIARFDGLLPGRYDIHSSWFPPENRVVTTQAREDISWRLWREDGFGGKTAHGSGVPVMATGESRHTLRLQTVRGKFVLRYKVPDGMTYLGQGASIGVRPAYENEQPGDSSGQSRGTGKPQTEWDFPLAGSGVRRITARMKLKSPPAPVEPFLWSQTTIAHSPYWARENPLVIPFRRREAARSVRVRGIDEDRHPISRAKQRVIPPPASWKRGQAETERLEALRGRVFLPDGRTPAVNASVWVKPEGGYNYPHIGFVTDATGEWHTGNADSGLSLYTEGRQYPPPLPAGGVAGHVVLAYLPGSHGATVVSLPDIPTAPLRIVLPPAIALSGTVTVDSKPLTTVPGFVRVVAVPVGQGRITERLSLETTAQADGSFVLAGLTPGLIYQVQASLEGVYLSPQSLVTVAVNAAGNLPSLALRLPRPGEPVVVPLGVKYADASATLVEKLPDGVLAPQTYALLYPVDGAGDLRVEGLPVGKWHLRLPDGKIVVVTVAPQDFGKVVQ